MPALSPNLSPPERSALDTVIGKLAHDLQAPVRNIAGLVDWIEEDIRDLGTDLPAETRDQMAMLRSRCRHLSDLVARLTDFEAATRASRRFDGDWQGLIDGLRSTLPGLDAFDLPTDFSAAPNVGQEDLGIILKELLSNACVHHDRPPGRVSIRCWQDADAVVLQVQDDGPGLPPSLAQRALDQMLCHSSAGTRPGLGLAILSRVAQSYGATFHIDASQVGRGTSASLRFPLT